MARLGSSKRPVVVRVQTQQRAEEILAICDQHGWKAIVGLEFDRAEDISELERLHNPPQAIKAEPKVGRNDPCPLFS